MESKHMTFYSLALFLHVGSALVLAAALSIDGLTLFQLRRVTTGVAASPWLTLWSVVPRMAGGSGLLLLVSGAYLTHRMSAWTLAWPKIALAALLLLAVFGVISRKRMGAIGRALDSGASEFEYMRRSRDPMLRVSLNARIGLLFAAVLLMNAQPAFWKSLAVVVGVSFTRFNRGPYHSRRSLRFVGNKFSGAKVTGTDRNVSRETNEGAWDDSDNHTAFETREGNL